MPRKCTYLKPWMVETILANTKKTTANTVKVLKHLEGPRADGSIVREVTDGTVFIKAIFSKEAVDEMFSEEESTQPEWYSALLVLKKYTVDFDHRNSLEESEVVLNITSASIWDLQQGYYLKYRVTDCMDNPDVRALANDVYKNYQKSQHRNESMDCSIPLTQLLDNMSHLETSISEDITDTVLETGEVDNTELIIPIEQMKILDSIEEWKADFVPSLPDNSQLSPKQSRGSSYKSQEVDQSRKQVRSIESGKQHNSQQVPVIGHYGEIVNSGESIKLSCSSDDDIPKHKEDLTHVNLDNTKVSSSSGELEKDFQEKSKSSTITFEVQKQVQSSHDEKGDNENFQKQFENFALGDECVTSTVTGFETQPFSPTLSSTQGFSPMEYDGFVFNNSTEYENKSKESNCQSHDRHGDGTNSDQSFIDLRPEEQKLKLDTSFQIVHSNIRFKSGTYSEEQKIGQDRAVKQRDVHEKQRLDSMGQTQNIEHIDREEEMRLKKLSIDSDDMVSPEDLLQLLNKHSSSANDDGLKFHSGEPMNASDNEMSDLPQSITDQTLLGISSREFETTSKNKHIDSGKTLSKINDNNEIINNMIEKDNNTQKHLSEDMDIVNLTGSQSVLKKTISDLANQKGVHSAEVKVDDFNSNKDDSNLDCCVSLKRGRCELYGEEEPVGKQRKTSSRFNYHDTSLNKETNIKSLTKTVLESKCKSNEIIRNYETKQQNTTRNLRSGVVRYEDTASNKKSWQKVNGKKNYRHSNESYTKSVSEGKDIEENEDSQNLLNQSISLLNTSRSPSKRHLEDDIIIISSCESATVTENDETKKVKENKRNMEFSENRLLTESEETLSPRDNRTRMHSDVQIPTTSKCDESAVKSSNQKYKGCQQTPTKVNKVDKFLSEIKPKTEIGKRLLSLTFSSDLLKTAINYYKNK